MSLYAIHEYSRSSPSGKAVGEDVPMDGNLAYGEVHIYATVIEWNENWYSKSLFPLILVE